jgi:hypothetical protein
MKKWYESLPAHRQLRGWEQFPKVVLKPVCRGCQERLNTEFEIPTRSLIEQMLDGRSLDLIPAQQMQLAGWFVKTAFIIVMAREAIGGVVLGPTGSGETLRLLLVGMIEKGSPPVHTTARLANLAFVEERPGRRFLPEGWPGDRPFFLSSLVFLPGIVSEVLVAREVPRMHYINATDLDDRFVRVWPPHLGAVAWPPKLAVGVLDVVRLQGEWEHPDENRNPGFAAINYPELHFGREPHIIETWDDTRPPGP